MIWMQFYLNSVLFSFALVKGSFEEKVLHMRRPVRPEKRGEGGEQRRAVPRPRRGGLRAKAAENREEEEHESP